MCVSNNIQCLNARLRWLCNAKWNNGDVCLHTDASQRRLSPVVDDELDIAGNCFRLRVHALRLFSAERGGGCENVRSPRTDAERGGSTREIGVLQSSAWYCSWASMAFTQTFTGAAEWARAPKITAAFSTLRPRAAGISLRSPLHKIAHGPSYLPRNWSCMLMPTLCTC
jgi:hypothetical protein